MNPPHGPRLGEDQRSRLMEHSQTRHYRKHQMVCCADDHENFFFFVTSGCLRVFFAHVSGREFSLSMLEPGSFFTSHAGLNIEAVKPSAVQVVDAAMVQEIMRNDPTFSLQLMKIVGGMLRNALHSIESLVFENLESRLAEYLLREISDCPPATNGAVTARHELSIEEIAKFVGGSRQSVSLLLGNWKRSGIVRHDHHRIHVEDPLRLYNIAQRPLH